MTLTLILSISIAVPMGVLAAWNHGTWIDRIIMVFAVFGFSVPVFVVGYVLAYVFALELDWFPVQGYTPFATGFGPWLSNLVLPAVALGGVYIALIARITRATMLEVLSQDYVRTAKAKGVGSRTILFLHALKNAAVPIVTVIGIGVALLIGGSVVTESVFAIPGLGTPRRRRHPAPRLPRHPGRRAAVQLHVRPGQPGRRSALHRVRPEDPLLMTDQRIDPPACPSTVVSDQAAEDPPRARHRASPDRVPSAPDDNARIAASAARCARADHHPPEPCPRRPAQNLHLRRAAPLAAPAATHDPSP